MPSRTVGIPVAGHHRRQLEHVRPLAGHRRADDAGGVGHHEGHLRCGDGVRGHDEIAFVLLVVVIDHDHHSTFGQGRERAPHVVGRCAG